MAKTFKEELEEINFQGKEAVLAKINGESKLRRHLEEEIKVPRLALVMVLALGILTTASLYGLKEPVYKPIRVINTRGEVYELY